MSKVVEFLSGKREVKVWQLLTWIGVDIALIIGVVRRSIQIDKLQNPKPSKMDRKYATVTVDPQIEEVD